MIRTVEITVPSGRTDGLMSLLDHLEGIVSMKMQRGVSLRPPGDVVTVEVSDRGLHALMQMLSAERFLAAPGISVTTSIPSSVISAASPSGDVSGPSNATWEEMETEMGRESNMTVNGLLLMFLSGVFAAVGLATNALHYVLAAMVVAPAFEPLVRVALGVVEQSASWRRGAMNFLTGYAALILGAALTTLILPLLDVPATGAGGAYPSPGPLRSYWTAISAASLAVSAAGGVAGAVLIVSHRSVLTAGAQIALALIPSAALVGMAAATADLPLLAAGALRLAIDAGIVIAASLGVFILRRMLSFNRKMYI